MYNQVVLFVGVITELFIWVVTLLTGIMFIASGLSNEEVIRSTVAITFILNVDELIYNAVVPAKVKHLFGEREFSTPRLPAIERLLQRYTFYVHIWVVIGLGMAVTAAIRADCGSESSGGGGNLNWNVGGPKEGSQIIP